jgi:hypothetical protein
MLIVPEKALESDAVSNGSRSLEDTAPPRRSVSCCSNPPSLSGEMLSFAVSVLKAEMTCVIALISIIAFVFENYTKV